MLTSASSEKREMRLRSSSLMRELLQAVMLYYPNRIELLFSNQHCDLVHQFRDRV